MTQQPNPKQTQPPSKEKSDREAIQREENEGSAGSTTRKPEQPSRSGLPKYGDREPGDPRRTDVEGDDVETGG